MLKNSSPYLIVALSLIITALAWGQQGNRPNNKSSANDILPAGADLSAKREAELAEQLRRMRDTEAVMGEAHPQRESLRKRIAEAQEYLDNLRSVPNPFRQFEEQGVQPRDIIEQLSEKELRVLVVRLAIDMKDLRERVAELEDRTSSKRQ